MAKKKQQIFVTLEFPDIDLKIEKIRLINQEGRPNESFFYLMNKDLHQPNFRLVFANIEALADLGDEPLVIDFVREDGVFQGFRFKEWFVPVGITTQVDIKPMVIDIEEYEPGIYRFCWSKNLFEDTTHITKAIITKE